MSPLSFDMTAQPSQSALASNHANHELVIDELVASFDQFYINGYLTAFTRATGCFT